MPHVIQILRRLDEYRCEFSKYTNNIAAVAAMSIKLFLKVKEIDEKIKQLRQSAKKTVSFEEDTLGGCIKLFIPCIESWVADWSRKLMDRVEISVREEDFHLIPGASVSFGSSAICMSVTGLMEASKDVKYISNKDVRNYVNEQVQSILLLMLKQYTYGILQKSYNLNDNGDQIMMSEDDRDFPLNAILKRILLSINNGEKFAEEINKATHSTDCWNLIEEVKARELPKFAAVVADNIDGRFHQYLDGEEQQVRVGEHILASVDKLMITCRGQTGDLNYQLSKCLWEALTPVVKRNIQSHFGEVRSYRYFKRLEEFLHALQSIFAANELKETIEGDVEMQELSKKLRNWAKNSRLIIYAYLNHMVNQDGKGNFIAGSSRHCQAPVKEGTVYATVGKLSKQGLVRVEGIRIT